MGVMRYDKLDQTEIKDLLLCFLYILTNLTEGKIILGQGKRVREF